MALIQTSMAGRALLIRTPGSSCPHAVLTEGYKGTRRTVDIWEGIGSGIDMGDSVATYLSQFLGIPCRLLGRDFENPRLRYSSVLGQDVALAFPDGYHLLMTSRASLTDLNDRMSEPVMMDCFRPNTVMSGCNPYAEDDLGEVTIGSARIKGVKLCTRCAIPMINQTTGVRNPKIKIRATGKDGYDPSATLATYRKLPSAPGKVAGPVVFGKYFVVMTPGTVRKGDEVKL